MEIYNRLAYAREIYYTCIFIQRKDRQFHETCYDETKYVGEGDRRNG